MLNLVPYILETDAPHSEYCEHVVPRGTVVTVIQEPESGKYFRWSYIDAAAAALVLNTLERSYINSSIEDDLCANYVQNAVEARVTAITESQVAANSII